jgi:antitoxin YefM
MNKYNTFFVTRRSPVTQLMPLNEVAQEQSMSCKSKTYLYNYSVQEKDAAMTIETTYSQAREQLKTLMDRAVDDREVILVRRRTGGDVAMIAADELESLLETAHLLRSTKNAQRLLTALTRARTESVKPITVADLQKQVGFDA